MTDPGNLALALLREMRADMATKSDLGELRSEMAELRTDMRSLRADVASGIQRLDGRIETVRKELSEQIAGLRRAVMESHSSAIGPIPFPDGVLISELDERLRRVEQHLNLAPDAH